MKSLNFLTKKDIREIKLIVLDVDGVLVKRGTKIKQNGNKLRFEIKKIAPKQIQQIKKLHELGFIINIASGRGLYYLQEMFEKILPFISLTYENGSATWYKGKIFQHANSFSQLKKLKIELEKIKNKNIKGFEPKEFIITMHCKNRVKKIEKTVEKHKNIYYIWNSEAYDIGIKKIQTKAVGLHKLISLLKLKKKNVLALGDNFNDKELLAEVGLAISADKTRVEGDFYVPLNGKFLPADLLMQKIIELKNLRYSRPIKSFGDF